MDVHVNSLIAASSQVNTSHSIQ